MRTTLTIDDDLAESLERYRVCQNLSLQEAVNELLRLGLQAKEQRVDARPYEAHVFNMGLKPGIDLNRLNQLADELEVEEYRG